MADALSGLLERIHQCGEELLTLLGARPAALDFDRLDALLSSREQLTGELEQILRTEAASPPTGLEALLQQQQQLEAAMLRCLAAHRDLLNQVTRRRSEIASFGRLLAPKGRSRMLDQRR